MKKDLFPTLSAILSWFSRRDQGSGSPVTVHALKRFDAGVFYRQTASMLRSGIPLSQALSFLVEEFRPAVGGNVDAVRQRVESGQPLSRALEEFPEAWVRPEDRAAVAAGERCGRLPDVLQTLASDQERWTAFRDRIRGVLAYPTTVCVLAVLIAFIILWKVVPTFAALYASLRVPLPGTTRIVIAASNVVATNMFVLVLAWLVWHFWLRKRFAHRLPIVRSLHRSVAELRFARLLALLLPAGVPLDEALALCEASAGNHDDARQLREAAERIRSGERPSEALRGLEFLSPVFLWFLKDSEVRGDFVAVAEAMSDAAEERHVAQMDFIQRIAEPLSILFLGLVIGILVMALYTPMFRLILHVGN